uniref:50S ribosomal protein L3, chloroplastic n=1 Tax=Araucaria cunninghamii TaxID=56994 RepID=A0A0D6R6I8_ARACU
MASSVSISIPMASHMYAVISTKSSTRTPTTLAIGGVGGGRGFKSGLPSLAGPWTMQPTQFSFNLKQVQLPTRRRGRGPGHCGVTCMASYEAGIGVMGTKLGMMTYFEPGGKYVPVTVVGFREGNIVTQIKREATDGYDAVQVGYRRVRDRKLTKPELGHLNKAGAIPMRHLQEFRLTSVEGFEPNQRLEFDQVFKEGDLVDVSGNSIGKGFQGGSS